MDVEGGGYGGKTYGLDNLLALLLRLRAPIRTDVPLETLLARHGGQDDLEYTSAQSKTDQSKGRLKARKGIGNALMGWKEGSIKRWTE